MWPFHYVDLTSSIKHTYQLATQFLSCQIQIQNARCILILIGQLTHDYDHYINYSTQCDLVQSLGPIVYTKRKYLTAHLETVSSQADNQTAKCRKYITFTYLLLSNRWWLGLVVIVGVGHCTYSRSWPVSTRGVWNSVFQNVTAAGFRDLWWQL